MKEICANCKGAFVETPTQFYNRAKTNSFPICRDCHRLQNALINESKRISKKIKEQNTPLIDKVKKLLRKHKTLSAPFLMRKFRITLDEANDILLKLSLPISS